MFEIARMQRSGSQQRSWSIRDPVEGKNQLDPRIALRCIRAIYFSQPNNDRLPFTHA